MNLANDICRCLDASCMQRDSCASWVERDTGSVQQSTFRRGLLPCCSFEPIREPDPDPAQGSLFV